MTFTQQIDSIYKLYQRYPRISIDTRKNIENSIFFCIKGEHFDGNQYALAAIEKGAAYVITENKELASHAQCVIVEDSLNVLQQLAKFHRKRLTIPIIGITGTNGKTTSKELIVSVLQQKYSVAFTQGNFNNHIGVPLTLLSIQQDDQMAVVELGANHTGEIATLCEWVLPDYALITNIGKAHLEGFGSFANIIATKKALYDAVMQQKGTLFVNDSDQLLRSLSEVYHSTVFYHTKNDTIEIEKSNAPYFSFYYNDYYFKTQLTGNYNLNNVLAAVAMGKFFGITMEDIVEAVANYTPQNMRSQIIHQGTNTIIADYYNANPSSMEVALLNLSELTHHRKMAILGEMRELGEESADEHKKIINLCEKLKIPTFFVGKEFCQHGIFPCFNGVDDLNSYLHQHAIRDTLLLIKGSRGVHLEKIVL